MTDETTPRMIPGSAALPGDRLARVEAGVTRSGVVAEVAPGRARVLYTEEGGCIGLVSYMYELIHRPDPTRQGPPTEPLSVIANVVMLDGTVWPLAIHDGGRGEWPWMTLGGQGYSTVYGADDIVSWEPYASLVVADGEPVTR